MAEHRPATMDGSRVCWLLVKNVLLGPALRLLFRPRAAGLEHVPRSGGAIVAANHVSLLDPLLLPMVIPRRRVMFLTKTKYIDRPALHWFFAGLGVIPVATGAPEAARGAVTAAVGAVRSGRLIGIFPEGTRSPDGRLHRGKTGVGRMALASGAPVIPAGIIGTDLALPRGARLPRPRPVRIVFGPPIRFPVPGDEADIPSLSRAATDEVMAAIRALSGQQAAEVDPAA